MSTQNGSAGKQPDLRVQKPSAKSALQLLIHHIAREARRQHLDYNALKHVFQSVREKCDIVVPTKPKRLFELPTAVELDSFYSVIKDPVHRLIFEFLQGSGLRIEEACSLEVKRIDIAQNYVFVFQGKGKKDRVTVIGNRLAQKIALYLENRNNRYLFESSRGGRFTTRRIEQICQKYKEAASITKKLSPHIFRHVWNSNLAAHGLSEERRAILAGHEQNSDVQKIYTHLSAGGFKSEVIAILDK